METDTTSKNPEVVDTIVHAADLHLGAPFESLGTRIGPDKADHLRRLASTAFDRLIELTVNQRARALVLAGDVYDNADREVGAQLRFQRGMRTLEEAGIEVFIAHGNHDPLVPSYRPAARLPNNVTVFQPGPVQRRELTLADGSTLTIAGTSFAKLSETANLARTFHDLPVDEHRCIAVLHTNVDGTAGHDNFAPCSVIDLTEAPVAYWALGHIHNRSVVALGAGRWYAYPGNLQGRSTKPSECGPKGALVVPLTRAGIGVPEFHPCDRIRFSRLDVDVSGAEDAEEALHLAVAAITDQVDEAEDRPVLVRLQLSGASRAHTQLAAIDDLPGTLRDELGDVLGDGELTSAHLATRIPVDRAQLVARGDLLSDLLGRLDALRLDPDGVAQLIADLPAPLRDAWATEDQDSNLIDDVEALLTNRLGAS